MNHPTHPGELPTDPNTAADPAHPQGRYEVTTEGYLRSSGEPWNALGNEAHNVRTSWRWLAQLLRWNFEYIRFPGDRARNPCMRWNIYDHHERQWLHPTLAPQDTRPRNGQHHQQHTHPQPPSAPPLREPAPPFPLPCPLFEVDDDATATIGDMPVDTCGFTMPWAASRDEHGNYQLNPRYPISPFAGTATLCVQRKAEGHFLINPDQVSNTSPWHDSIPAHPTPPQAG